MAGVRPSLKNQRRDLAGDTPSWRDRESGCYLLWLSRLSSGFYCLCLARRTLPEGCCCSTGGRRCELGSVRNDTCPLRSNRSDWSFQQLEFSEGPTSHPTEHSLASPERSCCLNAHGMVIWCKSGEAEDDFGCGWGWGRGTLAMKPLLVLPCSSDWWGQSLLLVTIP